MTGLLLHQVSKHVFFSFGDKINFLVVSPDLPLTTLSPSIDHVLPNNRSGLLVIFIKSLPFLPAPSSHENH